MSSEVEKEILNDAVNALEKQTGVRKESCNRLAKGGQRMGYALSLRAPQADASRRFRAEVRRNINSAVISQTAFQTAQTKEKPVLVTRYVSPPQADKLRELDIAFFDAAGNAYFNEPGLYIFVSGRTMKIKQKKIPRLFRPPGMKILFAFLTETGLENESYRRISAETNVPTPTVGVFMKDLESAGFLIKGAGRERRIVRRAELFKRWLENYGESFRPTLNPVRFRSKKCAGRWWEDIDIKDYDACWGGETAGAILTDHLKPEIATIYSDSLLPRLQAKYGLIRDERGNIEILEKFWTRGATAVTAPPLVIYADLLATADQRNLETAQIIYEQYLADITKTDS